MCCNGKSASITTSVVIPSRVKDEGLSIEVCDPLDNLKVSTSLCEIFRFAQDDALLLRGIYSSSKSGRFSRVRFIACSSRHFAISA
jgi:hypothetical protein